MFTIFIRFCSKCGKQNLRIPSFDISGSVGQLLCQITFYYMFYRFLNFSTVIVRTIWQIGYPSHCYRLNFRSINRTYLAKHLPIQTSLSFLDKYSESIVLRSLPLSEWFVVIFQKNVDHWEIPLHSDFRCIDYCKNSWDTVDYTNNILMLKIPYRTAAWVIYIIPRIDMEYCVPKLNRLWMNSEAACSFICFSGCCLFFIQSAFVSFVWLTRLRYFTDYVDNIPYVPYNTSSFLHSL